MHGSSTGVGFLQIVDLHDQHLGQKLSEAEARNSFIIATRLQVNNEILRHT
jgi:hypothetical protein